MATFQDELNSCLYFASAAVTRKLAMRSVQYFSAFDLSPSQGYILMTVKTGPGIITAHLADVLLLDASTVSKAVDKMVVNRLLQREKDGRVVRLFLTDKGLRKEADARAAWNKFRIDYTALIGDGRARKLSLELSKVQTILE